MLPLAEKGCVRCHCGARLMDEGRRVVSGLGRISFFGVEVVRVRSWVAHCLQMLRWNSRGAVCAIVDPWFGVDDVDGAMMGWP